jgi:tRNA modification GTPase
MYNEDTIVARATPPGEGAIAIVRMSGERALDILKAVFRATSPRLHIDKVKPHVLTRGAIVDPTTEENIDTVLMAVMRAPRSYTGENVVEIHCHGGPSVVRRIVEVLADRGARLAEPGEFTRRAFLNGRLDLAQAEAVCDLIQASTDAARTIALRQLNGNLSAVITRLRDRLIDVAADIEANLDFPDEEIPKLDIRAMHTKVAEVREEIERLLREGKKGRVYREGARIVFVGRPNTGKSSLFNALLGRERAIVTPHPGTTRDSIEVTVNLDGVPLTYVDTAGIRPAQNEIEIASANRTESEIKSADLVLFLIDISEPLQPEDFDCYASAKKHSQICVLNKIDLPEKIDQKEVQAALEVPQSVPFVRVSALQRSGMEALENSIIHELVEEQHDVESEGVLVSNIRHITTLEEIKQSLARVLTGLDTSISRSKEGIHSGELIMVDLNEATTKLGAIVGLTTDAEILDRIFSRFCIGK